MTVELRYATSDDIKKWARAAPGTMRAIVLADGDALLGVAGLVRMSDHIQCFSTMNDAARGHKRLLVRAARMVQQMVREVRAPVFAVCSDKEPTAPGLLSALGFKPFNDKVWRYG